MIPGARVLLTGSAGRIGRAIFNALCTRHEVIGIDLQPFVTTRHVGDFADRDLLRRAMHGVDAIVHTAALHAPHVGVVDDATFRKVNLDALRRLIEVAQASGVRTLVYTSTTALYGGAVAPGRCTWIDEYTEPRPETIYHHTKLEAEAILREVADAQLSVRVIRMSRCFPEPADSMALYRLYRGIDARDVATAHVAALSATGEAFQRYVVSGRTPFLRDDVDALGEDLVAVLERRCPALLDAFQQRAWPLPASIDRVYSPLRVQRTMGWVSRYGFEEVLAQHDRNSLEVLPAAARVADRAAE